MEPRKSGLVWVLYRPETQTILGQKGKFVRLEDFVKYPPAEQGDVLPPPNESIPDPPEVGPEHGPVIKCINGELHVCLGDRCWGLHIPCSEEP
jgi:hypothetical protein